MTEPSSKYELIFQPSAAREIRKLPRDVVARIKKVTDALCDTPRPSDARRLSGQHGMWRIRVGDYRIVYEINDDKLSVLVVRVAHRGKVYRNI